EIGRLKATVSDISQQMDDIASRISSAREYLSKLEAVKKTEPGINKLIREQNKLIGNLDKELAKAIGRQQSLANTIESLGSRVDADRALLREPDGDLKRAIKDALKRYV